MNKKKVKIYIQGLMLTVLLTWGGCQDDRVVPPDTDDEDKVAFVLRIPAPETPDTRTMDGSKEYEVQEAFVLAFQVNGAVETYEYYRTGMYVATTGSGQVFQAEFIAYLVPGNNYSLAVIANPTQDLKSIIYGLAPGTNKTTVLQQLQVSRSGVWPADGSGTYSPIPMYGETGTLSITGGTTLSGITLTRMLARIDVSVNLGNSPLNTFQLQRVHFCNYNTVGYLAPGSTVNQTNIPANPGKQSGAANALAYTVTGTSNTTATFAGEIYAFEAPQAVVTPEATFYNSICLVLEGSFNGQANTFYRVDFTRDGDPSGSGGTKGAYMPLLRNRHYQIEVTEAKRTGYATLDLALNSYGVQSNDALKTRTITYTGGEITDMVFDGEYLLGSSAVDGKVVLPKSAVTNEVFTIYTDHPDGFKVQSYTSASWMTLAPTGTTVAGKQTFTFNANQNTGATRTATLVLTAGRLTYTVVFEQ